MLWANSPDFPVVENSKACLVFKGSGPRWSTGITVVSWVLMMVEFRIHNVWIFALPVS